MKLWIAMTLTAAWLAMPQASLAEGARSYESVPLGELSPLTLVFGQKEVALPAGQWRLQVRQVKPVAVDGSNKLGVMVTLFFDEVAEGRLSRTLDLSITPTSGRVNWTSEPCKSKDDSYWIEDRRNGINDQFCLRVSFASGMVDQVQEEDYRPWAEQIRRAAVGYSSEMPSVQVTRYSRSDFLRMRMRFDPARSGIVVAPAGDRAASAWNPERAASGSPQEGFYKSLVAWAPTFAQGVARAFAGDSSLRSADYGAPVLPVAAAKAASSPS